MCFSPQADLIGGAVISGIGIDAIRHVRQRNGHYPLAALPLIFGAHQLTEAFVWWGLQGHVPHGVGNVAKWIYLLIAFVLLPTYVPLAVFLSEPARRRRLMMIPFITIGAAVSIILFVAMLRGPVTVLLRPYHLSYGIRLHDSFPVIALYVVAVCGALLFSGLRYVVLFGMINLVAIGIIAWLTVDGFASVWCGWAAISSAAIALRLRRQIPHPTPPMSYAVT